MSNVNAQEVTFGAKAGLNMASFSGDETGGVKAKTSFHVGAVAEIAISDVFSVQPELLFSAQGAKEDGGDGEFKSNYINLPIMAKYYVAEGLSVEAGPQVGLLISAEDEDGDDFKDEMSGIDFGLNLGVGYKMESGLNFAARYNLGLSNIWDYDGIGDFSQQNAVFQISVGYFFN
ncbi:porin family protein [Algibacter agarivorans]|uniref:Porin family protein n=2 Tax=Algibacter agarivorans TaxID=1109741 RepID=A0ABP9GTV8_9FLAO